MNLDQVKATSSSPWLLRTVTTIARVCAVMLLMPVACHPLGGGVVRFNGQQLSRSVIVMRVYPLVLVLGIGTLLLAGGLRRGRPWSRPAVALWFGFQLLLLLLAPVGMRTSTGPWLLSTLLTVLPVAGGVLAYLYYNPGAARYFEHVAAQDAQAHVRAQSSEGLETWLRKPNRRSRGA
jgi:hypothetical protein